MITTRIKKKGKQIDNIKKSMKRLSGEFTSVGYFRSQGMHVGRDLIADYSYPALAQALELNLFPPSVNETVPMPFMDNIVIEALKQRRRSPLLNRPMTKWRKNLDKDIGPGNILNGLGKLAIKTSAEVFGNRTFFPEAKPWNLNPLITTGELMKAYSFTTSLNGQVRRYWL